MAANGVGYLVFVEETMDQDVHLRILKNNWKDSARKLGLLDNFQYY